MRKMRKNGQGNPSKLDHSRFVWDEDDLIVLPAHVDEEKRDDVPTQKSVVQKHTIIDPLSRFNH